MGRVDTVGRLVEGDWEASPPNSTSGAEGEGESEVGRRRRKTSMVGVVLYVFRFSYGGE